MTQVEHRPGPITATLIGLARHTFLGRGKARKMIAHAVRSLHDGPLDVRLYGGRARLHHTGNNSEVKALLSPHRFARKEYAFCRQHMPAQDGVFVDIGGNAGIFSLYMASIMSAGRIIVAEPQPKMFARLKQNFELNPDYIETTLYLHQTAIGAEDGTLDLSIPESAGQASAHATEGVPTIRVPVRPLLSLVEQAKADKIHVLKIDVEGFEDAVLYPFFDTAPDTLHPRAIVMEQCHRQRWSRDCEALLLGHGYEITHKDRTNMFLVKAA